MGTKTRGEYGIIELVFTKRQLIRATIFFVGLWLLFSGLVADLNWLKIVGGVMLFRACVLGYITESMELTVSNCWWGVFVDGKVDGKVVCVDGKVVVLSQEYDQLVKETME